MEHIMLFVSLVACAAVATYWSGQHVAVWFKRMDVNGVRRATYLVLEDPVSAGKVVAPSLYAEASKSLTIVVPAYNEADRISLMLDEALNYLQARRDRRGAHFTYEVIVVDDGSSDATAQVVMEFVRRHNFDAVRLLQQPANMGKGAAVGAGVLCARGNLVLFADADGATAITGLDALEAALSVLTDTLSPLPVTDHVGNLGFIVGSRAHLQQQAENQRSWLRNFLMRGFHLLVTLIVGGAVQDTQCGFKLMTRGAARQLFANTRLQRWCFDVELIFLAQQLHIPIAEVPVNWTEIPGSKIRATSIIHMAWELFAIVIGYQWLRLWHVRTEAEL